MQVANAYSYCLNVLLVFAILTVATEEARKITKCTIDIKYCDSDAALDIYYPSGGKCTNNKHI